MNIQQTKALPVSEKVESPVGQAAGLNDPWARLVYDLSNCEPPEEKLGGLGEMEIAAYLDGTASPAECRRIEKAMITCPELRDCIAVLREETEGSIVDPAA